MSVYSPSRKDPIKALILERQKQGNRTDKELAEVIGVSRSTFRRMMNEHSDEWRLKYIRKLCWTLNVTEGEFTAGLTK